MLRDENRKIKLLFRTTHHRIWCAWGMLVINTTNSIRETHKDKRYRQTGLCFFTVRVQAPQWLTLTKAMLRLCVLVATFLYPQIAVHKRNHMFTVKVGPFELCCRLAIRRNHFNMLSGSTLKKHCCVERSSFGHGFSHRPPQAKVQVGMRSWSHKKHNAISAMIFERRSGSSPNAFRNVRTDAVSKHAVVRFPLGCQKVSRCVFV